jgi:hypothetical protein
MDSLVKVSDYGRNKLVMKVAEGATEADAK